MKPITKEEGGMVLARCWLLGLEEAARDFHGTHPKAFCERAYEHTTTRYLQVLEEQYGITVARAETIKEAIENYIEAGILSGLFRDASQFEIIQVNPFRLELKVLECPYRLSCEKLLESGCAIRDLTCARIGCFRVAAETLSDTPCKYEVTGFRSDGCCEGYIEHR